MFRKKRKTATRRKVKNINSFYVADAKNGKIGTYRTKKGAQNFLKKNRGGKIIKT